MPEMYDYRGDEIWFVKSKYADNESLAVLAYEWSTDFGQPVEELYAIITRNLDTDIQIRPDEQFVDENNLPGIRKWLEDEGIATYTGKSERSGYCIYPLMRFNEDFLSGIGGD